MFGNLTDKFFCLLLGVFSVFILVLKNTEGEVTERFVNVKRTPQIEKVLKTKCNGQDVEVALPSEYAAELSLKEAQAALVAKGNQDLQAAASKVMDAAQQSSGSVERYNENNAACAPGSPLYPACAIAAPAARRRRENYMDTQQPNRDQGFHTVPGQLQANLEPRQFLGATQASKAVTNNLPDDRHLTGRTAINDISENYRPNFNDVIEPIENFRENNEEEEKKPAPAAEAAQPIIYDRLVFKVAQSRKIGQGDMIRGDLPIVPCPQISQTAANPATDLQNGAMNVLFGQPQDMIGDVSTAELSQAASGTEQYTGDGNQGAAGIAVSGFA